jgi:PAS domain S-box-containing protein
VGAPRILVVEDETIVAMDLKNALTTFGYEVPATATSGDEAIRTAHDLVPDLIIMDVRIHGSMDGVDAAHDIRKSLDIPVVFLTAYGDEPTLQRAKTGAEPFAFLLKPFQERELRSAVEVALYKHSIEKKLRERERYLDTILSNIVDGVIATDESGEVAFMNPQAEALTGITMAEATGRPLDEVLQLEELDGGTGQGLVARAGKPRDATLISASGPPRPIEYSVTSGADRTDTTAGTVVVFRDISVRRQAEAAESLRQSRERLQSLEALIENMPEAVFCINQEHRVTLANRRAGEMLELLSGARTGEIVERLADRRIPEIIAAAVGNEPCQVVLDGPPQRTFVLAVTSRLHDVEAMAHIIVVREVTRELETRRLLEQQDRLASVGQLAAGMAHDLNNMLQTITGFAELIQAHPESPEEVVERAVGISRQSQRGAQLIGQILDFSRTSISERTPMDLGSLLHDTLKMLRRILPETIQVAVEIEDGDFRVCGDPAQLQQVITNIAVNARDAMPEGGELRVQLRTATLTADGPRPFQQMEPGEWTVLELTDTGTGIPDELMAAIFDPFFTTKEPGEGTGLGLAQVYGIVKQHGGFVDVVSEEGRGSSFLVYLKPETAELVEDTRPAVRNGGRGRLVLLVEDDVSVLEVLRESLEQADYAVIPATSGDEAVELFRQCRDDVDVVVSDVVMPGMGGVELYRTLRAIDPLLPVILMTGYPLRERAQDLPPDDHLSWISKPFSIEEIGATIGDISASGRRGSGGARSSLPTNAP